MEFAIVFFTDTMERVVVILSQRWRRSCLVCHKSPFFGEIFLTPGVLSLSMHILCRETESERDRKRETERQYIYINVFLFVLLLLSILL